MEECEVLWNYLPEGDIYALVETDEDMLEFLNLDINQTQIVMSKDNPKNTYVLQGQVIFIHNVTGVVTITTESVCVQNKDIIDYYKEPLVCIQSQLYLN